MKLLGGISSRQNGENTPPPASAPPPPFTPYGQEENQPAAVNTDYKPAHNVMSDVIARHETIAARARQNGKK